MSNTPTLLSWWIVWPGALLGVLLAWHYCRLHRQLNPLDHDFDKVMVIICSLVFWPIAIPVLVVLIVLSAQEKRLRALRNSRSL